MYNYPFYQPSNRYYQQFSYRRPVMQNKKTLNIPPKQEIPKEKPNISKDDTLFEIFGIKLYFDDILLICLIFFLYQEGVQDQYLFIALILLLLS